MTDRTETRCGFVTIIGAPNAGKSTLLNALLGTKISIVSPKVQTTRMRVRGIMMHNDAQLIFVDTPGIFAPRRALDRAMVTAAWDGQQEADITALIVDASRRDAVGHIEHILKTLIQRMGTSSPNCILILNKIDHIKKDALLPLAKELNDRFDFAATFMISALKSDGIAEIVDWCAEHVPKGIYLYPPDQISDLPERLLAAEITREKLFMQLHEELPYGLSVETEKWEVFENGDIKVSQIVLIARDAHKPIVLGKGGSKIKSIGSAARAEMEKTFGNKVHLSLFVKVDPGWMNDPEHMAQWGLDPTV